MGRSPARCAVPVGVQAVEGAVKRSPLQRGRLLCIGVLAHYAYFRTAEYPLGHLESARLALLIGVRGR